MHQFLKINAGNSLSVLLTAFVQLILLFIGLVHALSVNYIFSYKLHIYINKIFQQFRARPYSVLHRA